MAAQQKAEPVRALLSTKLIMPRPRRNYIVRKALFGQLSRCPDLSVIFIRGAAGSGKTTLLSSFITETGLKKTAWLSLDETSDSLHAFWHYFIAAAAGLLEDPKELTDLLASHFEIKSPESFLPVVINRLCSEEELYFVLDDVHEITDCVVVSSLEYFLRAMPENLHLFMLSREDAPVYLGSLAVSGRLLFIDSAQMLLSREESLDFLRRTMKLQSGEEEMERIADFAEGWIGGLQLAAADGGCPGTPVKRSGGFAAEYLTREIFEKLSPGEQDFLLGTGILEDFDADVCGRIFDGLDFQAMISGLLSKNLFLTCVDEERGIYRYHNILKEYLRRRIAQLGWGLRRVRCGKAARALQACGRHAETARLLLEAGDCRGAVQIILKMDAVPDYEAFLNRIPVEILIRNPDLAVRDYIHCMNSADFKRLEELSETAIRTMDGTPLGEIVREIRNVFSQRMPPWSAELPDFLSEIERYHLRPATTAFLLLGAASFTRDCRGSLAEQFTDRALQLGAGDYSITYYTLYTKAQIMEDNGRLNESLRIYRQLETMLENGRTDFMNRYNYHIGIAGVYLKRMELESAKKSLDAAGSLLEDRSLPRRWIHFTHSFNHVEYCLLSGGVEEGRRLVEIMIRDCPAAYWYDRLFTELSAEDALEPEQAGRILKEYSGAGAALPLSARLLTARLLFRSGEKAEAARRTESVLAISRSSGNRLRLVEAALLLLRMTEEDSPAARRKKRNLLREALYYSWENRILIPYYIDRKFLCPLLRSYASDTGNELGDRQRSFLQEAAGLDAPVRRPEPAGLLSARELEVLHELAGGLTNQEIAEKLCISLSTVKTHILNIYGKLGVSSRLMAVEEGKRKGLKF